VRNPSPHEICIVSKIVGKQRISPMLLPIIIEAPRINTEYTSAGMKNNGPNTAPAISDSEVAITVNGGAKYL
jgi:hypothetical protein